MNKSELIEAIAAKAAEKAEKGQVPSKKAIALVLENTSAVVKEALAKGDKVQLVGFGTFGVKERAARIGRNPRTGEAISIAASKAPSFVPGKALKDAVKAECKGKCKCKCKAKAKK